MKKKILCWILIGVFCILAMPVTIFAGAAESGEHIHDCECELCEHDHCGECDCGEIEADYTGVAMDEPVEEEEERIAEPTMIGDAVFNSGKTQVTTTFMMLSNDIVADSVNITVMYDPNVLTYKNSEGRLFNDYPSINVDVGSGKLTASYSGRTYPLGNTAIKFIFDIKTPVNTSVRFVGVAAINKTTENPNPEYTGAKFSATANINFCEHRTTTTKVTKAPTCQSDGTEEIWCTDQCKQRIGFNTIRHSETYHTFTERPLKTLIPATCTTKGEDEYKCQVCGQLIKVTVPALGHTYVGTKTLVDGVWKQSCSTCNLLLESPFQCEHDNSKYTLVRITKEATCRNAGEALYACSECGKNAYVEIPATHSYVLSSVTKQATTTSKGEELWVCSECGIRQIREIPMIATAHTHSFNGKEEIISSATCVVEGKKKVYCSFEGCNEYREVTIPKLNHVLTDWTVSKEATCTEEGLRYRSCVNCNRVFDESIPKIDHSFGSPVYTAPTCIADGSTVKTCTVCGYRDVVTHQKSNDYCEYPDDGFVLVSKPTCVADGVYECTCPICGKTTKTKSAPLNPDAHNWSEWTIVSETDCITDGVKTRSCSLCGKVETSVEKSTGHSFVTETKKNVTINTCSKCGMVETVTTTKKGNVKTVNSGMFTLTFDTTASDKNIYFNARQMDNKSYTEKVLPYNPQLKERGLGEIEMAFDYTLKLNDAAATVASASELSIDVGEEYKKIALALYYLDENGALQKVNDDFVSRQGTTIKVNIGTGTFKYPSGTLVIVNTGTIKSNIAVPIVIAILTIVVAAGVVFFVVSKNKKVTF